MQGEKFLAVEFSPLIPTPNYCITVFVPLMSFSLSAPGKFLLLAQLVYPMRNFPNSFRQFSNHLTQLPENQVSHKESYSKIQF